MNQPNLDDTFNRWVAHFASADREMTFIASETELSMSLMPGVILAGRIDALGPDWFMDAKTMNPRYRNGWKEKWRFHPQSLTYGLLLRNTHPDVKRFTIRVAFKTDPATFDHEWFSYSDGELNTWYEQVTAIATQILDYANVPGRWALNPLSCYKYGPKYPCPFLHSCTHQLWNSIPNGLVRREPHLQTEIDIPDVLILDATAITTYLECPEQYRRIYVQNLVEPPSEAMLFGTELHQKLDAYHRTLIQSKENTSEQEAETETDSHQEEVD